MFLLTEFEAVIKELCEHRKMTKSWVLVFNEFVVLSEVRQRTDNQGRSIVHKVKIGSVCYLRLGGVRAGASRDNCHRE